MKQKKQPDPQRESAKRPYSSPVLKVHGNLADLTRTKGGNKQDGGGKPHTRVNGPPA
jgi:hypothetical protein